MGRKKHNRHVKWRQVGANNDDENDIATSAVADTDEDDIDEDRESLTSNQNSEAFPNSVLPSIDGDSVAQSVDGDGDAPDDSAVADSRNTLPERG